MPKLGLSKEKFINEIRKLIGSEGFTNEKAKEVISYIRRFPSDESFNSYQKDALADDDIVDGKEFLSIAKCIYSRTMGCDLVQKTMTDVPIIFKECPQLKPVFTKQLIRNLKELVQQKKLSPTEATYLYMRASIFPSDFETQLLNQDLIMKYYQDNKTNILQIRNKVVFDPVNSMMMYIPKSLRSPEDEQEEIALRSIFGADNEAGMTNLNCMPIVKLHGELAEITGMIPGVNRDGQDDLNYLHSKSARLDIKTTSIPLALGLGPKSTYEDVVSYSQKYCNEKAQQLASENRVETMFELPRPPRPSDAQI